MVITRVDAAYEKVKNGNVKTWDVIGAQLEVGDEVSPLTLYDGTYLGESLAEGFVEIGNCRRPTLIHVINSINTPVCDDDLERMTIFAREVRDAAQVYSVDGANAPWTLNAYRLADDAIDHPILAAGTEFPVDFGVKMDSPIHLLQRSVFVLDGPRVVHAEYFEDQGRSQDYEPAMNALRGLL